MLNLLRSLVVLSVVAQAQAAPVVGEGWLGDFDAAVKQAKAEKKDLLVDFTGSDWCGYCVQLDSQVFKHAEFKEAVAKDYVLVALDFPRKEPALSQVPNPARNMELQRQHKITGYPTVLLMTADGEVFGRTGWQPGGATKYVAHLAQLRASGRGGIQARIEYESAKPDDKEAAWLKVVAVADSAVALDQVTQTLIPIVREGLTNDPANSKGHKRAAVAALLNLRQKDADLLAAASELDPKNEGGLLQRALTVEYRNPRDADHAKSILARIEELDSAGALKPDKFAFELYANSAMLVSQLGPDPVKAKTFATKALAIGSDDRRLVAICEQLVK